MADDAQSLEQANRVINRWWLWIRPYWHVFSFFIIITFIAATKWNNIQAYGDTLLQHEKRLSALEMWQASEAVQDAGMRQEIHDIHERVVGK